MFDKTIFPLTYSSDAGCEISLIMNYKDKLDRVFSEYIRLRDSKDGYFTCISCGKVKPYEQADCGHYINRIHMATRYSEINCNAQCRKCNRFEEGNMSGYRQGLIRKYGEQKVLLLEMQKNETKKYSEFEYKALITHYKKAIKKLKQ